MAVEKNTLAEIKNRAIKLLTNKTFLATVAISTVVIGTLYEGNKVIHKVTTLWDKSNNMLKAVIREWFLGAKNPSKHVIHGEDLK